MAARAGKLNVLTRRQMTDDRGQTTDEEKINPQPVARMSDSDMRGSEDGGRMKRR
jgi:hypothetical protein